MREIKFRGMNARGGWEYGFVVRRQFCGYDRDHYPECNNGEFLEYVKVTADVLGAGESISYGYKIYRDGHQSAVWVKRETVGQYIGSKDKTGGEIYEGDIVRKWFGWCPSDNPYYGHPDNPKDDIMGGPFQCFPVEFHQGRVGPCRGSNVMEWRLGKCHNLWDGPDVEVIGNRIENPELLKETK